MTFPLCKINPHYRLQLMVLRIESFCRLKAT
ncbi:MAG: hypothetical protein HZC45_04735 [Deltaproteobacteria bacterium]|nr:hypothetical protein [Deltaproteobacteria bacterium]